MLPDYEDICLQEPRLSALEAEVRAIRDDGTRSFFCSNYEWLPMYAKLKTILGVGRKEPPPSDAADALDPEEEAEDLAETGELDDVEAGILYDSRLFEIAYERLSQLMPPCRACGCRKYLPLLEGQVGSTREIHFG